MTLAAVTNRSSKSKTNRSVPFHYARFLMILVACFAIESTCHAQDESIADLKQQWAALDTKFVEKQAALESGEGDTKVLRSEYQDLVDEANGLIKKLKAASLKSIASDSKDKMAVETIMGILLNDAQNGNDAEVLSLGDQLISSGINPRYFEVGAKAERLSIKAREIFEELLIREREAKTDDLPRVKFITSKGELVIELYENEAPNTVANFISLVESGYYSDMLFHRVLEGFMAQTGQDKSDGSGGKGPGYTIECECNSPETRPHFSNCVSMAHAGPNTGGGQIFLTFSRRMGLDGLHTCFGRIISGSETLDKIERTHLAINRQAQPIPGIEKDTIIRADVMRNRDHAYKPKKMGEEEEAADEADEKPPAAPDLTEPKSNDDEEMKDEPAKDSTEAAEESKDESGEGEKTEAASEEKSVESEAAEETEAEGSEAEKSKEPEKKSESGESESGESESGEGN